VASRKAFLLRIDPAVLEDIGRWADEDLRSLNGQIEFLLRRALADAGRRPATRRPGGDVGHQPPPRRSKPSPE